MKRYLLFILSILFTPLFLLSQPFDNELNIFFDQMKTTENVATEIITTGADFNKSLLSDPSDYAQYTSDTIKLATYLGVYLSDLNYCLVYGQSNPARKLFSSAIELSKDLGVDKNALQFLMTRYDENKSQNDSLMNVVKQLFEKSITGLKESSKEHYLGVTIAAYQIETLHLALGVIETYPKDVLPKDIRIQVLTPLFEMVLGQQERVETIHTFLRSISDASDQNQTPNFAYYDRAFKELIGVYKRLNPCDAIANNRVPELLNDTVLNELCEKVNAIRNIVMGI